MLTTIGRGAYYKGDCIEVMRKLLDDGYANSIDAVITDPPYGLGFMGKAWDSKQTVAFQAATWKLIFELLKPGGHLLAFGGSRTYHRLACAVEDAGFEVRDQIMWLYGTGFPKSLDVSKAIDRKRVGRDFEDIRSYLRQTIKSSGFRQSQINERLGYPLDSGIISHWTGNSQPSIPSWSDWQAMKEFLPLDDRFDECLRDCSGTREVISIARSGIADAFGDGEWNGSNRTSKAFHITAPSSDAAKKWTGFGTALKPSHEPILLARKPFEGTVASNVLAHGTGALNIDGCRVSVSDLSYARNFPGDRGHSENRTRQSAFAMTCGRISNIGRWPANLIHDGSDEVLAAFAAFGESKSPPVGSMGGGSNKHAVFGQYAGQRHSNGHGDQGTAARFFKACEFTDVDADTFFYSGKATKSERAGSKHPTVKPISFMRYLCRLITPPDGLILDPFAGSGTTLEAAILEGFNSVGIEMTAEYWPDIERRLRRCQPDLADVDAAD